MRSTVIPPMGIVLILLLAIPARSETPEERVAFGTRVRIGENALHRLGVERRDVTVVYSSGSTAPCSCIADGIAIAPEASVGQGTLQINAEKPAAGTLSVAITRDKKTGKGLRYTIPAFLLPELLQWNKELGPLRRYKAVMDAPQPFQVIEVTADAGGR